MPTTASPTVASKSGERREEPHRWGAYGRPPPPGTPAALLRPTTKPFAHWSRRLPTGVDEEEEAASLVAVVAQEVVSGRRELEGGRRQRDDDEELHPGEEAVAMDPTALDLVAEVPNGRRGRGREGEAGRATEGAVVEKGGAGGATRSGPGGERRRISGGGGETGERERAREAAQGDRTMAGQEAVDR